jgi:uncharacterized C2H2 Zn-finger protein
MDAEKIEIPDELKILNPETQKMPIVIGLDAYMVYPLTEGQAERVSQIISDIITDITTLDVRCPNCGHVFKDQLGRQETCNRCSGKGSGRKTSKKGGHVLVSLQKPPVEALVCEERLPKLVEEILGIPAATVKEKLTVNQFKHIAGVLYVQNFKEEGAGLPDDSRKNFQALLGWTGLGAQESMVVEDEKKKENEELQADSEKSTKPLQANMDLQESTSGADGKDDQAGAADS